MALLAKLSRVESNRDWALEVITGVNESFGRVFEAEKIVKGSGGLHCHVLVALLDILGEKFTGRELWELCSENMERCLAIVCSVFATEAYSRDPVRVEACSRVMFQLTVPDTYIDCDLEEVTSLKHLQKLTGELHSHNNALIKGLMTLPVMPFLHIHLQCGR